MAVPIASKRASPYLSAARTRSLISASLVWRNERLAADDMVTSEVAAQLMGTTPEAVEQWVAKGRAVGVRNKSRAHRLPTWQFVPALWDALPALAAGLDTRDGWVLLSFFESPCAGLDGRTPRQAIEQGDVARVIDLAVAQGS